MTIQSKELKIGIKTEAEHRKTINWLKGLVEKNNKFPTNKQIQASIAREHLKEFPNYYTKGIKPMERRLKNIKRKGGKR